MTEELSEFEKLLMQDGLRADDPRLARYVFPAGEYQGTITAVARMETNPKADSGKTKTGFFNVSVKLTKPVSIDPTRKEAALHACEYSREKERAYYITEKAIAFWTDLLKSVGLADKNPITEAPKALIGKHVLVTITEEKSKSGEMYNPSDIVLTGIGK